MGALVWMLGLALAEPVGGPDPLADYLAMEITAPEGLSRKAEDAALVGSLRAKAAALARWQEQLEPDLASAEPLVRYRALVWLGRAEDGMARALRASAPPSYLTDDQAEIYRMALEDKAYVAEEKAVSYWRPALEVVLEHGWWCEREVRARLEALRPDDVPPLGFTPPPELAVDPEHCVEVLGEPHDGASRLKQAWLALGVGAYSEALELVGPLEGRAAMYVTAAALRGLGRTQAATQVLRLLVERSDTDRAAAFALADDAMWRGDADEALDVLLRYRRAAGKPHDDELQARIHRARNPPLRLRGGCAFPTPDPGRWRQLLDDMATVIRETRAAVEAHRSCLDDASAEEVLMILEQAEMVVEAEDVSLAQDIQQLLDAYVPAVHDAIAACEAEP